MGFLKFGVHECPKCGIPVENGCRSGYCVECAENFFDDARRCLSRLIVETKKNNGGELAVDYLENMIEAVAKYGDRLDQETRLCRLFLGFRNAGSGWGEILKRYA